MRIIVMCGKGGVGKSTLASALAVRAAAMGKRTLLFSVDPAHSLAATLGTPVGAAPTAIAANLWASELEPMAEVEAHWGEGKAYLENVLRSQGLEPALEKGLGSELAMMPGVQEFAALVKLKHYIDGGAYDVIILDNAPTAFSLRLLALPELLLWYAKHGMRIYERYGAQLMLLLPMLGSAFPAPSGGSVQRAKALVASMRELPAIFANPDITSARLVMGPDRLSLDEGKAAYHQLTVYGLNVDEVTINGALPDAVTDPFFADQKARERAIAREAEDAFAPLPVRHVERRRDAILGLFHLTALADDAWGTQDALARRSPECALRIDRVEGGQVVVAIKLPYVKPADVDLAKFENELYITIGRHRRNILLPDDTAAMQPVKAKFSEGKLLVTLAAPAVP